MKTNTKLHKKVREVIRLTGFEFTEEWQPPFTNFYCDFYLPEFNIAVEADGPHHKFQIRQDKERDNLIYKLSGCKVYRILNSDFSLKFDSEISQELIEFVEDNYEVQRTT